MNKIEKLIEELCPEGVEFSVGGGGYIAKRYFNHQEKN